MATNGFATDAPCIPKTITPGKVWIGLGILVLSTWFVFLIFFGLFASFDWTLILGTFMTMLSVGISVLSGSTAAEIVDFHGVLLFNPWARTRRVLFPGMSFKLPWEKVEHDDAGEIVLTSLVRAISTTETKNYSTIDPAVSMDAATTIHLRIRIKGVSPEKAAENFTRFRDIKEESLTGVVRAEIEKMFAEYYASHKKDDLLKPHEIQQEVWQTNQDTIEDMERKYGVEIGVVLASSKADKATQDMMRTPAMAEALSGAIKKLVDGGMDQDAARRAALILDPTNDYTEERFDLHVSAPDLKNLTHVNIVGAPIPTGNKKGGK